MLHDGAGLLVPVGDAKALAGAVEQILVDPATRGALVAEGQRRVEEFSATAMAEGVLSVYRSIDGDR